VKYYWRWFQIINTILTKGWSRWLANVRLYEVYTKKIRRLEYLIWWWHAELTCLKDWVSFIVEITPSFEPKGFQAIKITTSVKKGQDSCLTKSSKIVHAVEAHHLLVSQLWPSIIWRKDIPWRDDTGIPPHLKCIKHRNNFEGPSFFSFQHWSIVFNLSLRSQKKGIVPSLHWYYFMFHLRLNITLEQL
jgi:hypothetical protein